MSENNHLEAFDYDLPDERIARFPLEKRDHAKLLYFQQGEIQDRIFYDLPELLPTGSRLFFNNTKVIPARLFFQKSATAQGSGANIEIFLLHPELPSRIIGEAMLARKTCTWHCMIGNQKKWKGDTILERKLRVGNTDIFLKARLEDREQKRVVFEWDEEDISFVDIVEAAGQVPLPPYLKREATTEDKPRYQTVYSKKEGAVAAPTAGLHFTPELLQKLEEKGFRQNYLTLHVSAGTFQPIKEKDIRQHPMHSEQILVSRENVKSLISGEGPVIAVGTTSMRTLESLYWYGVMLHQDAGASFRVPKLIAYETEETKQLSMQEAMQAVLDHMEARQMDQLMGETEIFIFPGYRFRVCQGLITNFHMPKSTLILLISALVGDKWKDIYQHALNNDYRFLSYGDSSLLLP
ncbi:MAG: S-adenosylmethionine:tRNA ribosyltransferase-isomerase [Cyclobacteriaceae bacterium]